MLTNQKINQRFWLTKEKDDVWDWWTKDNYYFRTFLKFENSQSYLGKISLESRTKIQNFSKQDWFGTSRNYHVLLQNWNSRGLQTFDSLFSRHLFSADFGIPLFKRVKSLKSGNTNLDHHHHFQTRWRHVHERIFCEKIWFILITLN